LGSTAAVRLLEMGFNVAGWSRRPKTLPGVHCSTDLGDVLSRSDAVVCLLPLTASTRGILDRNALSKIRKDGCVINVARGGHVAIPDLLAALDAGHLAHAYLDVFETEPLPAESPLWDLPDVLITPHNSAAAAGNDERVLAIFLDNLVRWHRGEALVNEVSAKT
jgi:glyoxylate/hydroxypyruvate reductase